MYEIKYKIEMPDGTTHEVGRRQLKSYPDRIKTDRIYRSRIYEFVNEEDLKWMTERLKTIELTRGDLLRYIMSDYDLVNIIIERYKKHKRIVNRKIGGSRGEGTDLDNSESSERV